MKTKKYALVHEKYGENSIAAFANNKKDFVQTSKGLQCKGFLLPNGILGKTHKIYNVIAKSRTKTMSIAKAEKNGYTVPDYDFCRNDFDFEKNNVICTVKKYKLKDTVNKEEMIKECLYYIDNGISFSTEHYLEILD